jgi:LemA protein
LEILVSNGLIVLLGLLAVGFVWSVTVFNRLVRSRNRMNNAFAQIDVQLKRRHDLIPNLVNAAKGYLQHERQTLESVTLARQRASDARKAAAEEFAHPASRFALSRRAGANPPSDGRAAANPPSGGRAEGAKAAVLETLDRAEAGLNTALGKFALVVEAYPELKADHTIMQLSEELTSTENRISFSRQAFNDAVNSHNDTIGQFPGSLVANACGFTAAGQLRSTGKASERSPVMVHLS